MRNKTLIVYIILVLLVATGIPFADSVQAQEASATSNLISPLASTSQTDMLTIVPTLEPQHEPNNESTSAPTHEPAHQPSSSPTIAPTDTEIVTFTFPPEGIGILPTAIPTPTAVLPPPAPTPNTNSPDTVVASLYPGDTRSWTQFAFRELVALTGKKYDIDPQIIYATIMTESEGNIFAYRYEPHLQEASLCMGQILVSTARTLGFSGDEQELYNPDICIDLIGKYHRNMLDTFGPLTPLQLARAYNSGSPYRRPVWGHLQRFSMWYEEKG